MTLDRPLCVLDTETTGVDSVLDRIIELGVVTYGVDGSRKHWQCRFNPEMHIPEEATAVHGITDEDVKDAPLFADKAAVIWRGLQGKDICGYNVRSLDIPILDAEFRRSGAKLDLTGVRVIDPFVMFKKKEPRDLAAFVKRYAKRDHDGAHGAAADAEGTLDGWLGMLAEYEELGAMNLDQLAAFSLYDEDKKPADLAGKMVRDAEGYLVYNFGSVRGVRVKDNVGFATWMKRNTFPLGTIEVLDDELRKHGLLY